jgi:O-methyltransferase
MNFIDKRLKKIRRRILGMRNPLDWWGDGLGVRGKNLGFMTSEKFAQSLQFAHDGNIEGWGKTDCVPHIPWRTHVACWAASNALRLEGDFVECGVHTGLLSMAICHYLDFDQLDRKFYLFDTFEGIPVQKLNPREVADAENMNKIYFDVFELAKRNFSRFANVHLVKGELPKSLNLVDLEKICYLSIDLNSATYEKLTIEAVWDKLVPGAMVVIDDYAFIGHVPQYEMWNSFAKTKGQMILTLPTGQGLMQK